MKECEYCGKTFTSQRSSRKYCSDNCKQMAYYKRNGLVLANISGYDSHSLLEKEYRSVKDVKYDSTIKINDTLLNAIADRLLILLEQRISRKMLGSRCNGNENTRAADNVKPYFTENAVPSFPLCNPEPYAGISLDGHRYTVKDGGPAIVKNDSQLKNQPAKRDEITFQRRRKQKKECQPISAIALQNAEPEQISEPRINDPQFEELELALRNQTDLRDGPLTSEKETFVDTELPPPVENRSNDELSVDTKLIASKEKSENVKYEWVDSTFINCIEHFISNDFTDLSSYSHKKQYTKVLECFKCLIWTLVQISNRPQIDPEFFFKVALGFSNLTQSSAFKAVPASYPYYSLIVELKEKICAAAESQRISSFKLSPKRKTMLIAIRYQMSDHIKDLKFSELFR